MICIRVLLNFKFYHHHVSSKTFTYPPSGASARIRACARSWRPSLRCRRCGRCAHTAAFSDCCASQRAMATSWRTESLAFVILHDLWRVWVIPWKLSYSPDSLHYLCESSSSSTLNLLSYLVDILRRLGKHWIFSVFCWSLRSLGSVSIPCLSLWSLEYFADVREYFADRCSAQPENYFELWALSEDFSRVSTKITLVRVLDLQHPSDLVVGPFIDFPCLTWCNILSFLAFLSCCSVNLECTKQLLAQGIFWLNVFKLCEPDLFCRAVLGLGTRSAGCSGCARSSRFWSCAANWSFSRGLVPGHKFVYQSW